MTRQIHNKSPRKSFDRKTERSILFHLSGRGPSPGCRILQLLPALEACTTATSRTKSLNSQSTLTTMMRRGGNPCMIQQKCNLYYMPAYARYIRHWLIHCKYTPINQYTSPTMESHLTTDFPTQKYAKPMKLY